MSDTSDKDVNIKMSGIETHYLKNYSRIFKF